MARPATTIMFEANNALPVDVVVIVSDGLFADEFEAMPLRRRRLHFRGL